MRRLDAALDLWIGRLASKGHPWSPSKNPKRRQPPHSINPKPKSRGTSENLRGGDAFLPADEIFPHIGFLAAKHDVLFTQRKENSMTTRALYLSKRLRLMREARMMARSGLPSGLDSCPGYQLRECRGRGSFGKVWEATADNGQRVALKFMGCDGATATAGNSHLAAGPPTRSSLSATHPQGLLLFGLSGYGHGIGRRQSARFARSGDGRDGDGPCSRAGVQIPEPGGRGARLPQRTETSDRRPTRRLSALRCQTE